jgi:hypothetical protein
MKRSQEKAALFDAIDDFYNQLPSFEQVFDEETFYLFAFGFTCCTILTAFILSRFITLKEAF